MPDKNEEIERLLQQLKKAVEEDTRYNGILEHDLLSHYSVRWAIDSLLIRIALYERLEAAIIQFQAARLLRYGIPGGIKRCMRRLRVNDVESMAKFSDQKLREHGLSRPDRQKLELILRSKKAQARD